MNWDGYTIFSLISGLCLVALALAPGVELKERLWSFLGGAAFMAYAVYVANQTSGTFLFPIWVFVIPFVAVIYIGAKLYDARTTRAETAPVGDPESGGSSDRKPPS